MIPLRGNPPPKPLPIVITSGTIPSCSTPNIFPVRPNPVSISSQISSAPRSSAIWRSSFKYPGGGTTLPAVPWIGSTMIAATCFVVSSSIFRFRNSTQCHPHDGNVLSKAQRAHEAYGLRYMPGMRGPSPCLKPPPSTGSTPPVLPWKPPQKPITSVCPVHDFARRRAASTASAPLE